MVAELKAKTKCTLLAAASPSSSRIEPVEFDEFNDAVPPGPGFGRPLRFAGYILDLAGHSLHDRDGADIPLTRGEFGLLREFVQRPGRVLARPFCSALWPDAMPRFTTAASICWYAAATED